MTILRILWSRLSGMFSQRRLDAELNDEVQAHLALLAAEYVNSGLSPEAARTAARREFGGVEPMKEAYRDQRGLPLVDTFGQDARYAIRQLRLNPGFATVALLTLAFGIGANTAIFSVVDAVILKPLPYRDAERLVAVHGWTARFGAMPVNGLHFTEWRRSAESFEDMALIGQDRLNLSGNGEPERIEAARASPGLFSILGVQPQLGRTFLDEEDVPGRDRVVIITDGLWKRRFAGDPAIIGRAITLDGTPHEVVGVLPARFQFPRLDQLFPMLTTAERPEIWKPLALQEHELTAQGAFNFMCIARLKPGRSMSQAKSELDAITSHVTRDTPGLDVRTTVLPLQAQIIGRSKTGLVLLLSAVGVVLLIACVNIANLLLARVSARRRELAIRAAMGASRSRLARQLVVESLVLSTLGGIGGVAAGYVAVETILAVAPSDIARLDEVHLNVRVLLFTLGAATLVGLLMSILPARQAGRNKAREAVATGSRATTGGTHLRSSLVSAEIALSVVCLVVGGLLLNSFVRLLAAERGFETENVLTVDVSMDGASMDSRSRATFIRTALERVEAVPGVSASGVSSRLPLTTVSNSSMWVEGSPSDMPLLERPVASLYWVSPGYFHAMAIRLRAGRLFDERNQEEPPVAVVSQSTADRAWPGENPIGKRFRIAQRPDSPWTEVVGVVADVKSEGLDLRPPLAVYVPYWQRTPPIAISFAVKTAGDPLLMASAIRTIIRDLDPGLTLSSFRTVDDLVDDSVAQRRFQMTLVLLFGAAAMLLAGLGVFGVVSYAVLQRTQEIGVRLALGAKRSVVRRAVMFDALRSVAAGLAVGVPLAVASGFGMRALLFEVPPHDFVTIGGACLVLVAAAAVAAYVPARRASRVDPMTALRSE